MTLLSRKENGEILYCAAYLVWNGEEWKADNAYYHAKNAGAARLAITKKFPPGARVRIIGVAPVVGYFERPDSEHKNQRYVE